MPHTTHCHTLPHLLLLVLFSYLTPASGQQLPYYTQFREYQSLINPAALNNDYFLYEYNLSFRSSYRMQWINHPQTPRTAHLTGEYVTHLGGAFELVGGATVIEDRTGPQSQTGTYFRAGALLSDDPYLGSFSVGFTYGFVNYRVDASAIDWFHADDPNIPLEDISVTRPDLGVGLFYHKRLTRGYFREDHIYLGASAMQLLKNDAKIISAENLVGLPRTAHLYFTGGWYHFFNEDIFLESSYWVKYTPGAPVNVALGARFQPATALWVGGGFNFNGLVHLELGVNIPGLLFEDAGLKIGYGFDYNLSAYGLDFGTSHELNVAVLLDTFR